MAVRADEVLLHDGRRRHDDEGDAVSERPVQLHARFCRSVEWSDGGGAVGDKGTGTQRGPDAARAVPETLPRGRGASPLDRAERIPRARERVEPSGPWLDRREAENIAYWFRNSDEYDAETLEALEHVHRGGATCSRLPFETAFLIAEKCLDYDKETDALSVTEKGLDCLAFFEEEATP